MVDDATPLEMGTVRFGGPVICHSRGVSERATGTAGAAGTAATCLSIFGLGAGQLELSGRVFFGNQGNLAD